MLKQAIIVCCVVLLYWANQSDAHETYAASLGGAPVGLYGRKHGHGYGYGHRESESAASLGNAPVGLYHKHKHHRSYRPRPVWKYPAVVPGGYGPGVEGRSSHCCECWNGHCRRHCC